MGVSHRLLEDTGGFTSARPLWTNLIGERRLSVLKLETTCNSDDAIFIIANCGFWLITGSLGHYFNILMISSIDNVTYIYGRSPFGVLNIWHIVVLRCWGSFNVNNGYVCAYILSLALLARCWICIFGLISHLALIFIWQLSVRFLNWNNVLHRFDQRWIAIWQLQIASLRYDWLAHISLSHDRVLLWLQWKGRLRWGIIFVSLGSRYGFFDNSATLLLDTALNALLYIGLLDRLTALP